MAEISFRRDGDGNLVAYRDGEEAGRVSAMGDLVAGDGDETLAGEERV